MLQYGDDCDVKGTPCCKPSPQKFKISEKLFLNWYLVVQSQPWKRRTMCEIYLELIRKATEQRN